MADRSDKRDHWSSESYQSSAPFVPLLTTRLLTLLPTSPSKILDIGSGDGVLTSQLTSRFPKAQILALDASPSMTSSAAKTYPSPNITYATHDCASLLSHPAVTPGSFDLLFSNAAMHWILRPSGSRRSFFSDCFSALKSGGELLFEMGGAGNVAEIQSAITAVLLLDGVTGERIREVNPWFFPSETWMRTVLEQTGLRVEVCETEYRPTKLTDEAGVEGWVRLMCASFLEAVGEGEREGVVRRVGEAVEGAVTREEGGRWLGYVRLRCRARKP
ncbi:Methyltransferase-like protein 5 [Elsinoe fawcettii]|nr:Methyltransferase-like protein 5 [Elsinoe fawcettii]